MSLPPGWYKDPADPGTQRWWDGEGWIGASLPADQTPPEGPPPAESEAVEPAPPLPEVPGLAGSTERPAFGEPSKAAPERPSDRSADKEPKGRPGQPRGPRGAARPPVPSRPHGYPVATLGARFTARLVDIGIVLGLNVIVNGWFVYQYWQEISPVVSEAWRRSLAGEELSNLPAVSDQAGYLQLVILLLAAALWFAYEVPAVANSGQTPGKRLLKIKVVALEQDQQISFGRSFRRWNPMGLPVLLWWCFGIGFLLQLIDAGWGLFDRPAHQTLHDKSAYTAVVSIATGPDHPSPDPDRPQRTAEETTDEPADPS
ncbi:RDD family protein [Natronosporangium hydrolyticum]|uniref:RDD family protein n=1 Tax=Natronosporangium hydrolyticum TaxID=2811111 RepID=A0A895YFQ5_9ACTN|nr:RDD family protein [Natronosporangium hydrolyticum]QSB14942.1 RDD family protein [Natronosporangium hydrolyticum]